MTNQNQAINFRPYDIAKAFNNQYCSVKRHETSETSRKVLENNKKFDLDYNIEITTDLTKESIKKSKASLANGPDKMSNIHLKHLGPKAVEYQTLI